ncbi:MAG: hypothetical protein ACO3JL_03330, partial [Myxococcota bacterium]
MLLTCAVVTHPVVDAAARVLTRETTETGLLARGVGCTRFQRRGAWFWANGTRRSGTVRHLTDNDDSLRYATAITTEPL